MAQDSSDDNDKSGLSSFMDKAGWLLLATALGLLGVILVFPNILGVCVALAGVALLAGAAYGVYHAFKPDKAPDKAQENENSGQVRDYTFQAKVQVPEPARQPDKEPDSDKKDIEERLDPSWGPPDPRLPLKPLKEPEPIPSPQQMPASASDTSTSETVSETTSTPAATMNSASATKPAAAADNSKSA